MILERMKGLWKCVDCPSLATPACVDATHLHSSYLPESPQKKEQSGVLRYLTGKQ